MSVSDIPSGGSFFDAGDLEGEPVPADTGPPEDPRAVAAPGSASNPRAPNGRVLGFDLSKLDEKALLGPGGHAALYALGNGPSDFHPDRQPLILVHGFAGAPADLQALVNRFKDGPYQLYVLCYDSLGRRTSVDGNDLADELRTLSQRVLGPGRDVSIVAHSMGGIIARRALDELAAGPAKGLDRFGKVQFIAADTPWHGFGGPSDRGLDGFFMNFARAILPAAMDDMRTRSNMFAGDPGSADPAARAGLLGVDLPDQVETHLAFSSRGAENSILNYEQGPLAALPQLIADRFNKDAPINNADPAIVSEWRAILSSSDYDAFADELRDKADAGTLDANAVRAALERYYPIFPGTHTGFLGGKDFLDYVARELGS
jgi:hypothetical protein